MIKGNKRILFLVAMLLITTLACQVLTGENDGSTGITTTQEPSIKPTEAEGEPSDKKGATTLDAPFPLPPDVERFDTLGEGQINFQTRMSIDETIAFYRDQLGSQGLTERDILTVISEDAFSMVFDGAENGKALVIQGVLLEPGYLNVNIRYDDS